MPVGYLVTHGLGNFGGGGAVTPITLSVSDNANGTGGVATISGSQGGTVTVYSLAYGQTSAWTSQGSRAGDGTLAVTPGNGWYWWYAEESSIKSNLVYEALTGVNTIPVSESISLELVNRLEFITELNGFEITVSEVVRPKRNADESIRNYQVWVYQGNAEWNEEKTIAGNPCAQAWDQEFLIVGFLQTPKDDQYSVDELSNTFLANLIKGICIADDWWQFGGYSFQADFTSQERELEPEGGGAWVALTMRVTYRTDEDNPYILRT